MIKHVNINFDLPILKDFGRRPTTQKCIGCLLNLIENNCKGNILEIGTWYGKTTYELAIRYPKKFVYTIDYFNADLDEYINRGLIKNKDDIGKYAKDLSNVLFYNVDSKKMDFSFLKNVDFIFIDGDHSYEGVKADYHNSKRFLSSNGGGIIAFHDIAVGHTGVPKFIKEYLSMVETVFIFNNSNIGYIKVKSNV